MIICGRDAQVKLLKAWQVNDTGIPFWKFKSIASHPAFGCVDDVVDYFINKRVGD